MKGPTPAELDSFRREKLLMERVYQHLDGDKDATQFARDCDALIEAQIQNAGSESRNYLPFGPLKRLVCRIGFDQADYIKELFRPDGSTLYQLVPMVRSKVRRKRAARLQSAKNRLKLNSFGHFVLELEAQGFARSVALKRAQELAKLPGSSRRHLEQKFREFVQAAMSRGFVGDSRPSVTFAPRFGLSDMKARRGRPRKKTHET